ncbi:MAG: hypothetical protein PWP72_943 [Thermoanaerobacter sp.]|nr:hypothetical protein [Thermoanaerobacter sp.]
MRVLVATGFEELDRDISAGLSGRGIDTAGECYYREGLLSLAKDRGADVVVLSPHLPGQMEIADLVKELRMAGLRVILLPGRRDDKKAVDLARKAVALGVYDLVWDPVSPGAVVNRVLNPATLAEAGFEPDENVVSIPAVKEHTEVKGMLGKLAGRFKRGRKRGLEKHQEEPLSHKTWNGPEGQFIEPDPEMLHIKTALPQLPPDFAVLGNIPGARCYDNVQDIVAASPTAVVIPADRQDLVETIKSLRRDFRFLTLPVVILGDCDTACCYRAGADECITVLDGPAIERIRARATRMRKLWEQVERDPLTGLYNRRFLEKYLAEQERRYRETGVPFSLMMADLDHFKAVNDTYSHDAGDTVLREFASFLASGVRQTDVTVRYGGEEFIVVFPGTGDVREVAGRLCRGWAGHRIKLPDGQVIQSTFSGGLAVIGRDEQDAEALIRAADRSMYLAKQAGRNRVVAAGDRVEVVEKTAVQQSIASRQGQPAASLPKPSGMSETALSRPVLPVKRKEKIYLKLPTWRPEIPKPNVSRILSKIAPASKEDIPNLVAVWSPAPAGKTFTAVNLAAAYALKGYRTVLVSRDAISHSGKVPGLTVQDKREYRRLAEEFEVVVVDGYRDALRCAGQIMLVVNVTYLDAITESLDREELEWNKVWVVANGVPDEERGRVEAALQLKVDYVVPYTEGRPATTLPGPGLAEVFRKAAML